MSLLKFKINEEKIFGLAECSEVPKVMIIAGPNGVGKSTLLYKINENKNNSDIAITYWASP